MQTCEDSGGQNWQGVLQVYILVIIIKVGKVILEPQVAHMAGA